MKLLIYDVKKPMREASTQTLLILSLEKNFMSHQCMKLATVMMKT